MNQSRAQRAPSDANPRWLSDRTTCPPTNDGTVSKQTNSTQLNSLKDPKVGSMVRFSGASGSLSVAKSMVSCLSLRAGILTPILGSSSAIENQRRPGCRRRPKGEESSTHMNWRVDRSAHGPGDRSHVRCSPRLPAASRNVELLLESVVELVRVGPVRCAREHVHAVIVDDEPAPPSLLRLRSAWPF